MLAIIDESVKERMRDVLREIKDGSFAHRWLDENEAGRPNFTRYRETAANEPMERIHVGIGASGAFEYR